MYFNFLSNILILTVLFAGGMIWADTNGIWHEAEDVLAGTFGGDENGGDYAFPNNLNVTNKLKVDGKGAFYGDVDTFGKLNMRYGCMEGECYSNWSSVCENWVDTAAIN